ncbi:unnamed protein product [Rhodiola kirilowii]
MDHQAVADSTPLPPGCRFHPSEEQLLGYYLLKKNSNNYDEDGDDRPRICGFDLINELDIYRYSPFDLPASCCYFHGYKGRKMHWYCFCVRVLKERVVRRTEGGFWKRKGRVRNVVGNECGDGVVLGKRVGFVFYLGDLVKGAVRTNWYMHEYALAGPKAFVLCRVFVKFRHGHANSASEHAMCAHENVSAVRHIGVQHGENVTSDVEGTKECDINSVDRGIQTSSISSGKVKEKDDMKDPETVSGLHSQFQSRCRLCNHLVDSSITEREKSSDGLIVQDNKSLNDLTAQEFNCILEDDFIELKDLLSPLPGNDDT